MAFNKITKDPMRFIGQFLKFFDKNKSAYRTQFEKDYLFSIQNTRLVGSYSIMAQCDIRPVNPKSSFIDEVYLKEIPKKMDSLPKRHEPISIYLCADSLSKFTTEVLQDINQPFILVSGDSDVSINRSYLKSNFDSLVENRHLIAWYAQNRAIENPKIHSLPIGLDFHSKWIDPLIWGDGFILPALQELELKKIHSKAPPWSMRKPKAYCDWIFALNRGERISCIDKVDLSVCEFPREKLSRNMTWQAQSLCAFVISPSGMGLDCHRTWEALALGCVPIVKKSLFTDIFDGMPVIIVDDWSEITPSFLIEKKVEFIDKIFNYSNLFLNSWKEKFLHQNYIEKSSLRMTMDQFSQHLLH